MTSWSKKWARAGRLMLKMRALHRDGHHHQAHKAKNLALKQAQYALRGALRSSTPALERQSA